MLISILSIALMGSPDCSNGQCRSPGIRIRVPGVRVDISQFAWRRSVVQPLAPAPRYVRRGWFSSKWKYKAKYRGR